MTKPCGSSGFRFRVIIELTCEFQLMWNVFRPTFERKQRMRRLKGALGADEAFTILVHALDN